MESIAKNRWPGFDNDFSIYVRQYASTEEGLALQRQLNRQFMAGANSDKPFLFSPPICVAKTYGKQLTAFVHAYYRAIETIISAFYTDQNVQRVLRVPPELESDLKAAVQPENEKIHLCRLDFLLNEDGNFQVLETNANCPGGMIFTGYATSMWREYLQACGMTLPLALDYEGETWMADWFLSVAEADTGIHPSFVPILRPANGNTLELQEFTQLFHRRGVDSAQHDPRELRFDPEGNLVIGHKSVRHAYLKVGIQDFCRLRPQLDTLVTAVQQRLLFVQNGQRGRWIGDNKLCLALLSDPAFQDLFNPEDYEIIKNHIPWSRNIALCSASQIQLILENPPSYVLKRPFDTRGKGVVVGKEVKEESQWQQVVQQAICEEWLVQAFYDTTEIEADFEGKLVRKHDLTLGVINGTVATAQVRSSNELRVNTALSGSTHPVFFDR